MTDNTLDKKILELSDRIIAGVIMQYTGGLPKDKNIHPSQAIFPKDVPTKLKSLIADGRKKMLESKNDPKAASTFVYATSGMLSESICQICNGVNPVWHAPNELWNKVMRGGKKGNPDKYDFVCPNCFAKEAQKLESKPLLWVFSTGSLMVDYIHKSEVEKMLEFVIKEAEKSIMVIISTGASDVWMPKEKYQIESDLRQAQNKKVKRILKDLRQRAAERGIKL